MFECHRERLRWMGATGLLVATLILSPIAWAQTDEEDAKPSGVQPREVVLDNGLTLLMVERRDQPIVACGVFYDVGGANDPRGKSGIAHLFEHMLFKGSRVIGTTDYEAERHYIEQQDALRTKMIAEMNRMREMKRRGQIQDVLDPSQWTLAYSGLKKQYDQLVESQRTYIKNNELFNLYTTNGGAMLNAGTMEDLTMYFVQLPANKLDLFLWLESDRMVNGVMREFYVERDNVREERRLRVESTPTGKYREAFEALFWQAHPYGVPVLGWASEVESITRDDVRDFYKVYYAPNNARVVLVGDFDTDEVIAKAKQYFGRIPPGKTVPPPVITEEPTPVGEKRFNAVAETNPRVQIRFHTVAIGHSDEAALDVLGGLLSGKSGRLYKRLINEEDLAIGQPRASNQSRKYAGYFEFFVTVKEGKSPQAVESIILQEIDKLGSGTITDHELQRVKNQVLASSVQRLKNNVGLMFQLGMYDTWYDWTYINESPKLMLAVTAEDVKRVVKQYFDPTTRTVAIYKTKPGGATKSEDPELDAVLANIPPDQHERTRGMIKHIKGSTDLVRLEGMMTMMEQGAASGEIPEGQKAMFEYMIKVLRSRVAELRSTEKESD